jgi:hypothetical protein
MKHLKLFENVYASSDEYVKIEYRWHDIAGASEVAGLSKRDNLTSEVVGKIYELFKNRKITINDGKWINILRNEGSISIYSFFDEWYLVSKGDSSNTFYTWWKCDQDDQLESLLQKLAGK